MREPESLLDEFTEPPLRDFISQALFTSEDDEDDRRQHAIDQQVALDCLRKLQAAEVREEIQRLRERMGAAGGTDMSLLHQMQILMKKEKELHQKAGSD